MSRQILINEPNLNLRNINFYILMIDGVTPALDETGGQPEINAAETGWITDGISPLTNIGFGNYYATLTDESVNQLGIILSHYKGTNTLDSQGETIEVIQNYRDVEIFNSGNLTSTDSYVTLSEAETYFSTILDTKPWNKATADRKLKALLMATKDIDRLRFKGVKTSNFVGTLSQLAASPTFNEQTLEFPRNGDTEIPRDIKIACCEIAMTYLGGINMELEYASLNVIHQSFSGVRDSFDRRFVSEAIRAGINNVKAWTYIKPFLVDPYYMRLIRN